MKKIIQRWYISIFIIPILLTYLTNFVTLPKIFGNWKYSIITSLLILIGVLIYELRTLNVKFEQFKHKPKKRDKRIIRGLLEILDIDSFHEDIYEQNSWYGYRKDAIYKIINFTESVRLIKNKTSDDRLNELILKLSNELENFQKYSSTKLYGGDNFFLPNKDTIDARKIAEKESIKMNEMATICFNNLEQLMKYLRNKEYL